MPKKSGALRRKEKSLTESGALLPWELLFAEWQVRQPTRQSIEMQVAAATNLAHTAGILDEDSHITPQMLEAVKRRPVWRKYKRDLSVGGMAQARKQLISYAPQFADTYIWGLHQAKKYGDYKAAASIALPMLDRILPKKEDTAVQAVAVNISVKQADLVNSEPDAIETTYEVVAEDSD